MAQSWLSDGHIANKKKTKITKNHFCSSLSTASVSLADYKPNYVNIKSNDIMS